MTESERQFLEASVAGRAERQAEEEARRQAGAGDGSEAGRDRESQGGSGRKRAEEQALAAGGLTTESIYSNGAW